jgi:hypothetical protein
MAHWSFEVTSVGVDQVPGIDCFPFKAEVEAGNTSVLLTLHPQMSAGSTYTVTPIAAKDSGNNSPVPAFAEFTVSNALAPAVSTVPPSKGLLEVITHASGQQFQRISGRPETLIVSDFTPSSETVVYTESTVAFPSAGEIYIGSRLFTYTSKFDGGFKGVAPILQTEKTFVQRTPVNFRLLNYKLN